VNDTIKSTINTVKSNTNVVREKIKIGWMIAVRETEERDVCSLRLTVVTNERAGTARHDG